MKLSVLLYLVPSSVIRGPEGPVSLERRFQAQKHLFYWSREALVLNTNVTQAAELLSKRPFEGQKQMLPWQPTSSSSNDFKP